MTYWHKRELACVVLYCVFVAATVYFAGDFPKSVFIAPRNMYGSEGTVYTVYCTRMYIGQVVCILVVGSCLEIEVFNIVC